MKKTINNQWFLLILRFRNENSVFLDEILRFRNEIELRKKRETD